MKTANAPTITEEERIKANVKDLLLSLFDNPKTIYNLASDKNFMLGRSLIGNLITAASSLAFLASKNLLNEKLLSFGVIEALTEVDPIKFNASVNQLLRIEQISALLGQYGIETIPSEINDSIVSFAIGIIKDIKTKQPELLSNFGKKLSKVLPPETTPPEEKDFTATKNAAIEFLNKPEIIEILISNLAKLDSVIEKLANHTDIAKGLHSPGQVVVKPKASTLSKFKNFIRGKEDKSEPTNAQESKPDRLIDQTWHPVLDSFAKNHSFISNIIKIIVSQPESQGLVQGYLKLTKARGQVQAASIILDQSLMPQGEPIAELFKAAKELHAQAPDNQKVSELYSALKEASGPKIKKAPEERDVEARAKIERAYQLLFDEEVLQNVKSLKAEATKNSETIAYGIGSSLTAYAPKTALAVLEEAFPLKDDIKQAIPAKFAPFVDIAAENKDYISGILKTAGVHSKSVFENYTEYQKQEKIENEAFKSLKMDEQDKFNIQFLIKKIIENDKTLREYSRKDPANIKEFLSPIYQQLSHYPGIAQNEDKALELIYASVMKQKSLQNLINSATNEDILGATLKGSEIARIIDKALPQLAELENPKGIASALDKNKEYIVNAAKHVLSQEEVPQIITSAKELLKMDSELSLIDKFKSFDKALNSLLNKPEVQASLFNEGLDKLLTSRELEDALVKNTGLERTLPLMALALKNTSLQHIFNNKDKELSTLSTKDIVIRSINEYIENETHIIETMNIALDLDKETIKSSINKIVLENTTAKEKMLLKQLGIDGEFIFKFITKLNDQKKLKSLADTLDKIDLDKISILDGIKLIRKTEMTGFLFSHIIKSYTSNKMEEIKEKFFGKSLKQPVKEAVSLDQEITKSNGKDSSLSHQFKKSRSASFSR